MAVSPSDCEYVSPDVIQAPQHYCGKRNEKDLLERSGVAITGVVNQHIEAAKGIEREVERVPRGNLIGDVERDRTNPVSIALH